MRVLKWMLERVGGQAMGHENAFGVSPGFEHLHWDGLSLSEAHYTQITSIDSQAWRAELKLHEELFEKLHHHLPIELEQTRVALEKRLFG